MKFKNILAFCAIGLCISFGSKTSFAQNFVVFSGSFETFPDSRVDDIANRPALSDVETRLGNSKFHLGYPLAGSANSQTALIGKLSYEQLEFDFNNDSVPNYQPRRLHELGLELTLRRKLKNNWNAMLMAKPNIASDFENIEGNHLNFDAGLILTKRSSRKLTYGFGVRYTTDFGEPLFIPAAIVRYSTERFKINGLLPKSLEVMWLLGPSLEIGLTGNVSGNHYRIGEEAVVQNSTDITEGRIKYSVVTLGPAVRFGLSKNIFIALEGGVASVRRFQIFDKDDDEIDSLDLERKFVLRGGIQLRR